jgi:hypothetical protein
MDYFAFVAEMQRFEGVWPEPKIRIIMDHMDTGRVFETALVGEPVRVSLWQKDAEHNYIDITCVERRR